MLARKKKRFCSILYLIVIGGLDLPHRAPTDGNEKYVLAPTNRRGALQNVEAPASCILSKKAQICNKSQKGYSKNIGRLTKKSLGLLNPPDEIVPSLVDNFAPYFPML